MNWLLHIKVIRGPLTRTKERSTTLERKITVTHGCIEIAAVREPLTIKTCNSSSCLNHLLSLVNIK